MDLDLLEDDMFSLSSFISESKLTNSLIYEEKHDDSEKNMNNKSKRSIPLNQKYDNGFKPKNKRMKFVQDFMKNMNEKEAKAYRYGLIPRIVKNDIRRFYSVMFANVYNKCDINHMIDFTRTYYSNENNEYYLRKYVNKTLVDLYYASGLDNLIDVWKRRMSDGPDTVFLISENKYILRADETSLSTSKFIIEGTTIKLKQKPSQLSLVPNTNNSINSNNSNKTMSSLDGFNDGYHHHTYKSPFIEELDEVSEEMQSINSNNNNNSNVISHSMSSVSPITSNTNSNNSYETSSTSPTSSSSHNLSSTTLPNTTTTANIPSYDTLLDESFELISLDGFTPNLPSLSTSPVTISTSSQDNLPQEHMQPPFSTSTTSSTTSITSTDCYIKPFTYTGTINIHIDANYKINQIEMILDHLNPIIKKF